MKTEAKIQQEIITDFKNNNLGTNNLIFHVPNQNQHRYFNIGVMAGVSDLIVITKNKLTFVEVKDESGKQSPAQKVFESKVKELGFEYYLVRSLEDFNKCTSLS